MSSTEKIPRVLSVKTFYEPYWRFSPGEENAIVFDNSLFYISIL